MLAPATRDWLLAWARWSLARALAQAGTPPPGDVPDPGPPPDDPELHAPTRVFVSWHLRGRLHGCIGTLEPVSDLVAGVARYAVLAGLYDRRTPPLEPGDLSALELEISRLGPPRTLPAVGLEAIAAQVRPGIDGVVLSCGERSAFFLPVVWETLREPNRFLHQLCLKAGIDPAVDGPQCRADVLGAEVFGDRGGG